MFFIQGYDFFKSGHPCLILDRFEPPAEDYLWIAEGKQRYPVREFLEAKLWDGRSFLEAESEMEWSEC